MIPEPYRSQLQQQRQEAAMRDQLQQQYKQEMDNRYVHQIIPFRDWLGQRQQGKADGGLAKFLEGSHTPMRLYHGTQATEGGKGKEAIRRFKASKEGALGSGVYMTPKPEFASEYASPDELSGNRLSSGNVLPVHARLTNPLIIGGVNSRHDPMVEALIKLGMDEDKASNMVEKAYEDRGYIGKQVQSRAQARGHDGLMLYHKNGELGEVVHYNPRMIKSAIGNRGTYDTTKDDLSMKRGGSTHDIHLEERPL